MVSLTFWEVCLFVFLPGVKKICYKKEKHSQQLIILALHKGSQNVVRESVPFHGNTVCGKNT